jgi:hypothetical protein
MKYLCLPCAAYGFNYCLDDPNLVNLNKNKCYEFQSDKEKYCKEFDMMNNFIMCPTMNVTNSDGCDILTP